MNKTILLLLISIGFFSCNNDNSIDNHVNNVYQIEKLDSVSVYFLGRHNVHDIDPLNKRVIFEEMSDDYSQNMLISDFDGNIIHSLSKFGDRPDSYGGLLSTMRFTDFNRLMVYGINGFMEYDYDGDLISRVKLVDYKFAIYRPIRMGQGMERIYDNFLYVNQDFPPQGDFSQKKLYDEMHLLKILNPKTGISKPIINFPEGSLFKNGKIFFRNAWDPVYHLSDEKIYVSFGLEPVIYIYEDKEPYHLISSIPLNLKEYRNFKGADSYSNDWRFFGLRFTTGFILNIKKVNGVFLVAYFPGYDAVDEETRFSNQSEEEVLEFNHRMKLKYPDRLAILDTLGNVLNDFVPEGLEPRSMLLRDGQLWMMEKPNEEEERDYFRLFRVGLKFGNK